MISIQTTEGLVTWKPTKDSVAYPRYALETLTTTLKQIMEDEQNLPISRLKQQHLPDTHNIHLALLSRNHKYHKHLFKTSRTTINQCHTLVFKIYKQLK